MTTHYFLPPEGDPKDKGEVEIVHGVVPVNFRLEIKEGGVRVRLYDDQDLPKDATCGRSEAQSVWHFAAYRATMRALDRRHAADVSVTIQRA